jgi:hypothetical protein
MDLDTAAWERWSAYRIAIKKPMKPQTEEAAKIKLSGYGDDQSAVVDQSIANGWQGLFPLTKQKADPNAPKVRTKEQQNAEDARWAYAVKQDARNWDALPPTPFNRLKLCSAMLARYDVEQDQGSTALAMKREWLTEQVAGFLREADPQEVLNDLELWRLVLRLFNSPGINRLEYRAAHRKVAA